VNALEALREAMELEHEGYKFYSKAAQACGDDNETREIFKKLARDEKKHIESLELIYDTLSQENRWLVMQDLLHDGMNIEEPDIFDEEVDEDLTPVEALKRGIESEEQAVEFYHKLFQECEDTNGCEIFKWLVDFEKDHVKTLKHRLKMLTV